MMQKGQRTKWYRVKNEHGAVICEGTSEECAARLGVKLRSFQTYVSRKAPFGLKIERVDALPKFEPQDEFGLSPCGWCRRDLVCNRPCERFEGWFSLKWDEIQRDFRRKQRARR